MELFKLSSKLFRPSNSTDGAAFEARFCDQCTRGDGCRVRLRAMIFEVTDTFYPSQWQYNDHGQPVCTAFRSKAAARRDMQMRRETTKRKTLEKQGQGVLF